MKKNGFTLVELIAVIVILGLLIAFAVPSVLTISEKMKADMFCTKIENIEDAANLYGDDKFNDLKSINEEGITVDMLESASESELNGYIDDKYVLKVTLTELIRNNKLTPDNDDSSCGVVIEDEKIPCIVDPRDEKVGLDDTYVLIFKRNNRIYSRYQYNEADKDLCEK